MSKKTLAIALMSAFILAACGGSGSDNDISNNYQPAPNSDNQNSGSNSSNGGANSSNGETANSEQPFELKQPYTFFVTDGKGTILSPKTSYTGYVTNGTTISGYTLEDYDDLNQNSAKEQKPYNNIYTAAIGDGTWTFGATEGERGAAYARYGFHLI